LNTWLLLVGAGVVGTEVVALVGLELEQRFQ
jgi:hypothetical protein